MLPEALTVLASTGGTALVTAMVTDGWEGVKERFVRLLSRAGGGQARETAEELERSRAALGSLSGPALQRAREEQEVIWRNRLAGLLSQDPSAAGELRALVTEVQAQAAGLVGRIEQHAAAFDQAQQAIQGHGVQNVTFGRQSGRGDDPG